MFEDRLLIWKAKQGDQQAFDRIYHKYLDCLLSVAVNLLGPGQEAEDVVQDVYVKLIESLPTFELRGSLKAFLATCVANRAKDRLRKQLHQTYTNVKKNHEPSHSEAPWQHVVHSEQLQKICVALDQLPYEQKEIITLKIHGGLSFRALARQLELPLGTVQARYRYGLNRLRSLLNGEVTQ
jgi:RNA polymerase sigma-70 factor (ECF subfamily)